MISAWGTKGTGQGQFLHAHRIAVNSKGNVRSGHQECVRIQKFNSQGEYVTNWGLLGCGDDHFLIPHDIALDSSGNIYVTDSDNVHFLLGDTCQSFDSKEWTTTFRKVLTSTMSGDNLIPPNTNVVGNKSITIPQNQTEIEYKIINITGRSNISSAYIRKKRRKWRCGC